MPLILGHRARVHCRLKIVESFINDSRLMPTVANSKGETALSLLNNYRSKISAKNNSAVLYRLEQQLLDKITKMTAEA